MTKLVILGRKSKTGNYEAFFRALPAQIVTTLVPGEVISCGIFGMVLLTALSKYKNTLFGKQAAVK